MQAIACKFNGQISHFNQILYFEKYMTDSFEVSLLGQIEKEKIRYNERVLKRFYQYKVVEHLKDSSAMFGYKYSFIWFIKKYTCTKCEQFKRIVGQNEISNKTKRKFK